MIVLVGFMGAGKSTVGALLAERLNLPFVDTDALIERRAGTPVAEIFTQAGEPAFRALEHEVVAEVLAGEDAVVALGGGALGDTATCAALAHAAVVYLDTSFPVAMDRVGGDTARPLLGSGDPRALFVQRQETYFGVADISVKTDEQSAEDVAEEIARRLASEPRFGARDEGPARTTQEQAPAEEEERAAPAGEPERPPVEAQEEQEGPEGEAQEEPAEPQRESQDEPVEPEVEAQDEPVEPEAEAREPGEDATGEREPIVVGPVATEAAPQPEAQEAGPPPPPPPAEVPVRRVCVDVPGRAYDVVVGAGLSERLVEHVPVPADAELAFVITHPRLEDRARRAASSLGSADLRVSGATIPEGEAAKSLSVAERLYDEMAAAGAHRHDLVVSFGGGVVCDVAGFVASTYHRGMPIAHMPTTLLAQVDAAIGGKTGVNLPQGKNLVGTIHQPCAVVCDVDVLGTLEEAEFVSGLAEVVKYGLMADPDLLEIITGRADVVLRRDPALLAEVVARSAEIKSSIVAADEGEHGVRAHLNYGHTFGHAIEAALGFEGIRHGEAISLGMMAAAYLAEDLGRINADAVESHRRALRAVGLPTSRDLDPAPLEEAWAHDKKYRRGVRFVLLERIGRAEAGIAAPADAVRRAVERLSA